MMRGRTFRGQSPDGTWHEGFLIRSPGVKNSRPGEGWYINSEQEPAYAHLVKPFTIGMNTTLTDGNGAPVFEGDILKDDRCGKDVIFAVRYGEYICLAHKGRVLGAYYYHNKRYISVGDCIPRVIYMPYDEAKAIIGEKAARELWKMQEKALIKFADADGAD